MIQGIENKIKSIIFVVMLLIAQLACVATALATDGVKLSEQELLQYSLKLNVAPNRCISLQQDELCETTLTFEWESNKSGKYCLYEETEKQHLECWEKTDSGEFTTDFQSKKDKNFYIVLSEYPDVADQVNVAVSIVTKKRKRHRRRRRHLWSFP